MQVDDEVPLFVGLLHDNYNPKKNVFGPVQHHIISEQFARIFFGSGGDWWENRLGAVSGFEDEIHRATFGSVINDNTRSFVQTNAFKVSGGGGKKGAPPATRMSGPSSWARVRVHVHA